MSAIKVLELIFRLVPVSITETYGSRQQINVVPSIKLSLHCLKKAVFIAHIEDNMNYDSISPLFDTTTAIIIIIIRKNCSSIRCVKPQACSAEM
jgi:hypothetical protein